MDSTLLRELEELIVQADENIHGYTDASKALVDIGSPSVSIAILDDGQITAHCFSVLGHNEDTLFQAASISKPIAALALMKLMEAGHFSLDDAICDLLPSTVVSHLQSDPDNRQHVEQITVKHLMSHTAGISVHGFPGYENHDHVADLEQIIIGEAHANTRPIKMVGLPGLKFMYSGGGIQLLQCIAERKLQQPFADIAQEWVLRPLGMTRSHYRVLNPNLEKNFAEAYYTGYTLCENKWHVQPELAAAGLWTTPSDLLRAISAVQHSLSGREGAFLRKEIAESMLTLVKEPMALSWFVSASSFGHGGSNNPGYRCQAFGYANLPQNLPTDIDKGSTCVTRTVPRNSGIAIMTNAASGDRVIWKVIDAIAFLKGWGHPPLEVVVPLRIRDGESFTLDDWAEYLGRWEDGWTLTEIDGKKPAASIEGLTGIVNLRPAAIPPREYSNGKKSIDLVLNGRDMMLRLGWEGDQSIIEVFHGNTFTATTLRRSK